MKTQKFFEELSDLAISTLKDPRATDVELRCATVIATALINTAEQWRAYTDKKPTQN